MLINPLNALPWTIGGTRNAIASYKRIKEFLSIKDVLAESHIQKLTPKSPSALEVKCGKAIWPTQKSDQAVTFALNKIDYTISPGAFHILVGKVSSGKTAFLHLLMNELEIPEPASFSYNRNGKIAYVGQNAWLQKGSIKVLFQSSLIYLCYRLQDNILFGKDFNEKFYAECVDACDLRQDIKRLPGEDQYGICYL